jgi:hypothetical protein
MKTFNDITLKQYKQYMLLEDKSNAVEVVKILIDNWKNKTNDQIKDEIDHLNNSELSSILFAIIEINGKLYGLNKKKLSFGEFIDLQTLMDGNNFWDRVEHILEIYYRPIQKISWLHRQYFKIGMWLYKKANTAKSEKLKKKYLSSASEIITKLKYTLEEYNPEENSISEQLLSMKMGNLYGTTLFFWTLIANYSATTLSSLQEEMNNNKTKVQE